MGKDTKRFWIDRIRTLVSMATDSFHIWNGENLVNALAPSFLQKVFFILASYKENHYISDVFEIWPDSIKDCGVSCP